MRLFSPSLLASLTRTFRPRMVENLTCAVGHAVSETSMPPPPEFIEHRIKIWEKLKQEYDAFAANQPRILIAITLADGNCIQGTAWETTPTQIALGIRKSLAESCVIAKVNGQLWDMDRPLEGDSTLELLKFDNKEGQQVFWHSSAHVLGEALELFFSGHLCYGPPIEEGFYYDMWHPDW
ncbi:unnamed protein product [Protopolystoma xenopodis]|uniref:threonine--tRNA ligase n=1 Tax=Protopolystoma xenopodis TaxID=117903 RepID=A0A448X5U5_9PLAT|nr:unnamed protein product [Protopolystoma xenopodis]